MTNSISSNINVDRDLVITSNNSINMQASNIYANNNIEFNTNILNILATTTNNITNTTTKTNRTMTIKNNNNGISSTKIIDSNIVSKNNNYNFNINNEINIQRYSGNVNVSDISNSTIATTSNNNNNNISNISNNNISNNTNNLNSINTNNNINTPSYIIALRNQSINSNNNTTPKFTETLLSSDIQTWSNTSRQMTTAGQISVAVGAVALSIATGGIGSGVSGAMMTAAATTAGTIATNTGIQVGMNADGDIFKKIKDTTKEVWDNTTSDDSLRSIAISAAIAGVSRWAIDKFGNGTTMEKGDNSKVKYKPDKSILEEYKKINPDYNGVIDKTANNIGRANTTTNINLVGTPVDTSNFTFLQNLLNEGGTMSRIVNEIGGMNTMSLFHDPLTNNSILSITPLLETSIIPATAMQYCATFPGLCGGTINYFSNDNFRK